MLVFLPVRFDGSFRTIDPYSVLCEFLRRDDNGWAIDEACPESAVVIEHAKAATLQAAKDGILPVYIHVPEQDPPFLRVPVEYFRDGMFGDLWLSGSLFDKLGADIPTAYANRPVMLLEKEAERWLASVFPPSDCQPGIVHTPRNNSRVGGRTRNDRWNDWIAYLALCIHEGGVHAAMTDTAAFVAIADKMAKDDLDELPRSTVQTALGRVLQLLRQKQD